MTTYIGDLFHREQWIKDAEDSEKSGNVFTCKSIINNVIGKFLIIKATGMIHIIWRRRGLVSA